LQEVGVNVRVLRGVVLGSFTATLLM